MCGQVRLQRCPNHFSSLEWWAKPRLRWHCLLDRRSLEKQRLWQMRSCTKRCLWICPWRNCQLWISSARAKRPQQQRLSCTWNVRKIPRLTWRSWHLQCAASTPTTARSRYACWLLLICRPNCPTVIWGAAWSQRMCWVVAAIKTSIVASPCHW